MKASITLHAGILTLLLGASWRLANSESVVESVASVSILDIEENDLTALRYESADRVVELDVSALGDERFYAWARLTEEKEVLKPHNHEESQLESFPGSGEHAAVEMTPEKVEETSIFKAGSTVEGLLKALTPFEAKRLIERTPSDDRLEQWGLVSDTRTVVLQTTQGEKSYLLGGTTYRTRDRYLLDQSDNAVYLLKGTPFKKLDRSQRSLVDKSLFGAKESEILSLAIEGGETQLVLEHQNRADRQNHKWTPVGSQANAESMGDWTAKLIRLLANAYVQPENVPTNLQTVLSITAESERGAISLALSKGTDPEGDIRWYAQSDYTRELVTVDLEQAATLAGDFEGLVE